MKLFRSVFPAAAVLALSSASAFVPSFPTKRLGVVQQPQTSSVCLRRLLSSVGVRMSEDSATSALYVRKPRPEYIPGHIPDPHYVRIRDTTLRDGEQSPGATLTSSQKLDIARSLAKVGGRHYRGGFPRCLSGRLRRRQADR